MRNPVAQIVRLRRFKRYLARVVLALFVLIVVGEVASFFISRSMFSFFDFIKLERPKTAFVNPNALHVLAIGDSYTYGAGSDRQARKFTGYPEILARILVNPDGSPGVEVINLGVPAYDSAQTFKRLQKFLNKTGAKMNSFLIF